MFFYILFFYVRCVLDQSAQWIDLHQNWRTCVAVIFANFIFFIYTPSDCCRGQINTYCAWQTTTGTPIWTSQVSILLLSSRTWAWINLFCATRYVLLLVFILASLTCMDVPEHFDLASKSRFMSESTFLTLLLFFRHTYPANLRPRRSRCCISPSRCTKASMVH